MPKVGIIRCQQTEDLCPGTTDSALAKAGKGAFEQLGPSEIVGFVSCGAVRGSVPWPAPGCSSTGARRR